MFPDIYFFLSDLFGFHNSLRYKPRKTKGVKYYFKPFTYDLVCDPGFENAQIYKDEI